MPVNRPNREGIETKSMITVRCPKCGLLAWANLGVPKDKIQRARTICCGVQVEVRRAE